MRLYIIINLLISEILLAAAYTRPITHVEDVGKEYVVSFVSLVGIAICVSFFYMRGREEFKKNWYWYIAGAVGVGGAAGKVLKSFML